MRRRISALLVLALGALTLVGMPVPAQAADAVDTSSVAINEVESDPSDWVELVNTGAADIDIAGWYLGDDSKKEQLKSGVIPAHGYLTLTKDKDFSFGLGNGDEVHLYLADGTTVVDEMTYAKHATTTWGRCPDAVGPFTTTVEGTPGAANACSANPADALKINEVESNGDAYDWIELKNTALVAVDASGLILRDNDDKHALMIPQGTTVAAGGYVAIDVDDKVRYPGSDFGLGGADSARLFAADGTTLIDSYAWTAHAATTYGRCPDGTGAFATTTASTKAAANACPLPEGAADITINEVENDGGTPGDWVELYNKGTKDVDVSSWYIADDGGNKEQLKPGTVVPAGGYRVLDTKVDFSFGLGKDKDEVHLYLADGVTVVDEMSYSSLSPTTLGRCPNGTGPFVVTASSTRGAANACTVDPAAALKINEVESDAPNKGSDWVELFNSADAPVDASGLLLKDSGEGNTITIPQGTSVAARGYVAIDVTGLGKDGDSARLFTADGATLIDSTTWTAASPQTWGRCPDGSGAFADTAAATRGAANSCPRPAGYDDIVINEVESNGDATDWVEIYNTGTASVDVSGWIVRDDKDADAKLFPQGTVIAPKGFAVIDTNVGEGSFGLGNPDKARLYLADGTTLVDGWAWESHARTTYGLCPDGVGDYTTTFASTRGAPNDCSPVRINEIQSNDQTGGPDWVELTNAGESPVDLSGYVLKDNDDSHAYTIAAGTTLAPGAFAAFDLSASFGLGSADSIRLFAPGGTALLAAYSWTSHAPSTWARCPDATGAFAASASITKGAANDCGQLPVEAWPGAADVTAVDGYAFGADMSGLVYESTTAGQRGKLWAVNNGTGTLFQLVWDARSWVPAAGEWSAGKKLLYPDGTGTVDAEGVTIVGGSSADGVYVASERNNAASGISRPSVLRYDVSTADTTLTATHEWNLASAFPGLGANSGLEGISWIPDATLVGKGFVDEATRVTYDPAVYPGHGDGVFFVGVEGTKKVYGVVLMSDGTWKIIATIDPGLGNVAEVQFDPATGLLWAICDDACNGQTVTLAIAQSGPLAGSFRPVHAYENPAGMTDSIANEGLAFATADLCVDGLKPVFYADDANTGGRALREGRIACDAVTPGEPGEPGTGGPGTAGPGGLPETGGDTLPVAPAEDALTPQTRDGITTSGTAVEQGGKVTVTVGAAHAGKTVHGWIFSTPTYLGSAVVDAAGIVTFTIPTTLPAGQHRLVVTDASGAVIGWTSLTVTAARSLAATGGTPSFPLVPVAGILMLVGAALFVMARRRAA